MIESVFTPNPYIRGIVDSLAFKFERSAVIDVRPGIFWVCQKLVNYRTRPRASEIGEKSTPVQPCRNFPFGLALSRKSIIDISHNLNFFAGSGHKNDAVSLNALVYPTR
jgi:hypothetical protein